MIETIITGLLGLVGTVITHFLTKKKYQAEVRGKDIDNMSAQIKTLQTTYDMQIKSLQATYDAQIESLKNEIVRLNEKLEGYVRENRRLTKELGKHVIVNSGLVKFACKNMGCAQRCPLSVDEVESVYDGSLKNE